MNADAPVIISREKGCLRLEEKPVLPQDRWGSFQQRKLMTDLHVQTGVIQRTVQTVGNEHFSSFLAFYLFCHSHLKKGLDSSKYPILEVRMC